MNYLDIDDVPLLTSEFLQTLVRVARTYGWEGDYVEVRKFVEWCFEAAGKDAPDLEPFSVEDEKESRK